MSIKLGSFADISPLLDRQIEELVAAAQQTQEELGLVVATPSAITALTTEGGWGNILLNYSYTNYNGHLYTEIWRSADAIFANGHAVGATAAKFYTDAPENAQLTDVYYYWVRNVNLEGDTSDWYGPASGSIAAVSSFNVDDLLGQLGFEHFASGTMPIRSEAVLPDLSTTPANYPVGSIIYLTSNQLLYKNVAWVWKELIAAEDMVGEITETQIADGSISTPKLQAQSVTANELMANSVIAGKIAAGALAVDDGVMQNGYIKNALIANGAITNAKISGVIYSELQYAGQPAWELNKNGNLIIRGTSGLPIFQSGGTLDFADVSGLTKPADNADATDYTTINGNISTAQATAETNAKAHADAQDVLYETSNKNYTESWSSQGADVTAAALSATTQITEGGLIMLDNISGDYVEMTPGTMKFNNGLFNLMEFSGGSFILRAPDGKVMLQSGVTMPADYLPPEVINSNTTKTDVGLPNVEDGADVTNYYDSRITNSGSFTGNVTGSVNNVAVSTVTAGAAAGAAAGADATAALNAVSDMTSDNALTNAEKITMRKLWADLDTAYVHTKAAADLYGTALIPYGYSSSTLASYHTTLSNYLYGAANINSTTTSVISGSTLNSHFYNLSNYINKTNAWMNQFSPNPGNPITSTNIGTYISDLAVGTIKIGDNAVTVPSYAAGLYSATTTIFLNYPGNITAIASFIQGSGKNGHWWRLYIDGYEIQAAKPAQNTTGALSGARFCSAGNRVVTLACDTPSGDSGCGITVLGTKK